MNNLHASTTSSSRRTLSASAPNVVAMRSPLSRISITDSAHEWREAVVARLNELVRLERGWDGYSGASVSFENAHFTLRMLEATCDVDAPVPQIVPGSEGDLQVEWHHEFVHIELHVRAPNDVHAWRVTRTTAIDGEEVALTNDFIIVAGWVRELAESIRAVAIAAA
jgi:hypothetical protein